MYGPVKFGASRNSDSAQAKNLVEQYMRECVSSRDKLTKFMDKLDGSDAAVKQPFSLDRV